MVAHAEAAAAHGARSVVREIAALLELDPRWGARVIALERLEAAYLTVPRLEKESDVEALHDFRVAVRRLRSWLRACRPWTDDPRIRREERHLRDMAHATGERRDLEVQIALVESLREGRTGSARKVVEQLLGDLRARLAASPPAGRSAAGSKFRRMAKRLRTGLSRFEVEIDSTAGGTHTLRSALVGLVERQRAVHARALGQVADHLDRTAIHRARIEGKRLRYILEPVAAAAPAAAPIAALRALQDGLGDVHDLHMVMESLCDAPDTGTGRRARIALRGELESAAADRLAVTIGSPNGVRYELPGIDGLIDFLRAQPADVEIERKYLLSGFPPRAETAPVEEIEQGYIPGVGIAERLRRSRSGGESRCYRTIKAGRGIARLEVEEEVEGSLFRKLWPATSGRRVRKRRYSVPDDLLTWEIDRFRDRDLVLAEVELPSEDAEVRLPEWLAPWVVREVTGEDEYVNLNLAC
jgi:CHAD domain-containing protein/CYTH domain-containing protein